MPTKQGYISAVLVVDAFALHSVIFKTNQSCQAGTRPGLWAQFSEMLVSTERNLFFVHSQLLKASCPA